jgi:ABC-type transporter Mla subunit MlaD
VVGFSDLIERENNLMNNLGSTTGSVNPQIMKINVDKRKLDNLLNKFTQWKEDYNQVLQQYNLKLQHSRDKQAMLNSEQVSFEILLSFFFRLNLFEKQKHIFID